MVKALERVFQKILNTEDTLSHLSKILVTQVFKKGDRCNPEIHRALAFLSSPGKVFNKHILEKIIEKTERCTSNTQYGFKSHRGTIDAIFIFRHVMQKTRESDFKLNFNFFHFKSAFDKIWRKAKWKMMTAIGINSKAVNIIENMYNKTICSDGYQTG